VTGRRRRIIVARTTIASRACDRHITSFTHGNRFHFREHQRC
jgi:hypothetical protein